MVFPHAAGNPVHFPKRAYGTNIGPIAQEMRKPAQTEKGAQAMRLCPHFVGEPSTRSYGEPAGINRDVDKCLLTSSKILAMDSNVPFTVDLHPPWSSE